ncbi:hypothetical protein CCACVL1_21097 [Corchorus capsularis]|uniref:Uncharacterized protein n=1 Tax=Corchorus capsularis TaxID=210143 RepID=A0A1R3H8D1_COCAP|nr:hypothetical protein CCACVL1_21097 [Corchorus capsularis]
MAGKFLASVRAISPRSISLLGFLYEPLFDFFPPTIPRFALSSLVS